MRDSQDLVGDSPSTNGRESLAQIHENLSPLNVVEETVGDRRIETPDPLRRKLLPQLQKIHFYSKMWHPQQWPLFREGDIIRYIVNTPIDSVGGGAIYSQRYSAKFICMALVDDINSL
jgi:hypothetical protein